MPNVIFFDFYIVLNIIMTSFLMHMDTSFSPRAVNMYNAGKQPYKFTILTTSGYTAIKTFEGKVQVFNSEGNEIQISRSSMVVLWSCSKNSKDVDGDPLPEGDIKVLDCSNNSLEVLDIRLLGTFGIEHLICASNNIRCLNLYNMMSKPASPKPNLGLKHLDCSNNRIETINLSDAPLLESVNCSHNRLRALVIDSLPKLGSLNCSKNRLNVLRLGYTPLLRSLIATGNPFCGFGH